MRVPRSSLRILPTLTPVVASVIIWGWIFHPQLGVLNYLLSLVGLHGGQWFGRDAGAADRMNLTG